MSKKFIAWFEEVDKNDIAIVGGKGANLGEMFQAGFPIPYGFVVTSQSYFHFIEENNLERKIKYHLAITNFENSKELSDTATTIRKLITNCRIPPSISRSIVDAYDQIMVQEAKIYKKKKIALSEIFSTTYDPLYVAVRSSATAEDLPEASFAGQQETYLNVHGDSVLLHKVRDAWASLFTERAIYYRYANKFDHMKVGLAAVVQRMVNSEVSGIAFSIDPVTNDKSRITIEAILGLGEYIVGGKVTPDHYEVDKKTFSLVGKKIKKQEVQLVRKSGRNKEIKKNENSQEKQKINDGDIIRLAKIVSRIERHYFFPQDIEWAYEGGVIFIVQSRPITTIKDNKQDFLKVAGDKKTVILKGDPASPGIRSGRPVVIFTPKEIGKISSGDILVAPQTNPDYVPAMRRAAAIVTERGGRTSHAAIV